MNRIARIGMVSIALLAGMSAVNGCMKTDDGSASGSAKTEPNPGPRIGTVDFEKVAKGLEWSTKLNESVATQEATLKKYFQDMNQNFRGQLLDKMKALGIKEGEKVEDIKKRLTEAQFNEFAAMNSQANQIAQGVDRQMVQLLQAYRNEWTIKYRNALEPAIQQVASDRKLSLVLSNGQFTFADPTTDVTTDVIAAALKLKVEPSPVKPIGLPNELPLLGLPPASQPTTKAK